MTQTKTDPSDAKAIAEVARNMYQATPNKVRQCAVNPNRNPELAVWITEFSRLHKAIVRLRQQLDSVQQLPGQASIAVGKRLMVELKALKQSKKEVTGIIDKMATTKEVAWVASIPGIGTVTAATLVNKIGAIERFKSAEHLKGYLGCYPAIRQSGKRRGKTHMAKNGDRLIRHQLFNCAKSASRCNPACRELYERIVARSKSPLYAWVAVMRKLIQIVYGVLKNKTPFNPKYNLTLNG